MQQQRARTEEARRGTNQAFQKLLADHRAYFKRRLEQTKQLPLEQQQAELDRLEREEEAFHRDVTAELDRQGRELDREQMINAQSDLTDAINNLSDEIEQSRMRY